ncbi:MAG: FAD-binding monooxygenase, partial [Myxococcota bacterium]|nr:FAD-binding monooxygenase [Myxococcota bacterium]
MAHAFGTVVVLGGSMGGMLAAAVAARSAEQVVVIERDALDGDAVARKGVPQGRHNHNLFAGGREVIERLLPGVTADLRARGAIVEDSGATGRW